MPFLEIENMKRLLQRMQQEDPNYRVFGARQHRYLLGPTLAEAELTGFEQKHGIKLPDDYRFFLAAAGNGGRGPESAMFMDKSGAGPAYGLLTLNDAAQECSLEQPFPFTESTENLEEAVVEAAFDSNEFPGIPGALALCHCGSGIVDFLVVNGLAYGTIWTGREDFYPTNLSFDAWYGKWLKRLEEHVLPRLANERKIVDARVGMTKAEVIDLCEGTWEQQASWGGKSVLKFEHLSTEFEVNEKNVVTRIIAHSIY